jgi:hypothetical protein
MNGEAFGDALERAIKNSGNVVEVTQVQREPAQEYRKHCRNIVMLLYPSLAHSQRHSRNQ